MLGTRLMLAAVACAAATLVTGPAEAADHLVSREHVSARLAEARDTRAADLAALGATLETPTAVAASARLGVDAGRLRAAIATLDDGELRDLAQRARLLQTDPRAGLTKDVNDLLIIFLIIAIVVLVLQAVN